MDSKIKKWIMVMLAVLVISAAAAGFMPEWKKTSAIGKGKDYVAEIRIDGTIYGGPRNGTLLGASEGVSSEQVMYEMEQARKDNRVKGSTIKLDIDSKGKSCIIEAAAALSGNILKVKIPLITPSIIFQTNRNPSAKAERLTSIPKNKQNEKKPNSLTK